MKRLTYGQLPRNPKTGVYLRCPDCWERYSAQAADYFMIPPHKPVTCGRCGAQCQLRIETGTSRPITPEKAEAMS